MVPPVDSILQKQEGGGSVERHAARMTDVRYSKPMQVGCLEEQAAARGQIFSAVRDERAVFEGSFFDK
jgi:hypothetical protein